MIGIRQILRVKASSEDEVESAVLCFFDNLPVEPADFQGAQVDVGSLVVVSAASAGDHPDEYKHRVEQVILDHEADVRVFKGTFNEDPEALGSVVTTLCTGRPVRSAGGGMSLIYEDIAAYFLKLSGEYRADLYFYDTEEETADPGYVMSPPAHDDWLVIIEMEYLINDEDDSE